MEIGNESKVNTKWKKNGDQNEHQNDFVLLFSPRVRSVLFVLFFFVCFHVHNFISIKLGAVSIELLPAAKEPTEALLTAEEDGRDRTQR